MSAILEKVADTICAEHFGGSGDVDAVAAIIKRVVGEEMPALTDERIDQIEEKAHQAYAKHRRGVRGQMVTRADGIDYWMIVATANAFRAELLGEK